MRLGCASGLGQGDRVNEPGAVRRPGTPEREKFAIVRWWAWKDPWRTPRPLITGSQPGAALLLRRCESWHFFTDPAIERDFFRLVCARSVESVDFFDGVDAIGGTSVNAPKSVF